MLSCQKRVPVASPGVCGWGVYICAWVGAGVCVTCTFQLMHSAVILVVLML